MEEIIKRIKIMGIKKSHVAEKVGVSKALFSMYLHEKRPMPADIELKVKTYLGL